MHDPRTLRALEPAIHFLDMAYASSREFEYQISLARRSGDARDSQDDMDKAMQTYLAESRTA